MAPKIIIRLVLPIPLIIDGIRMARGVTGKRNTDNIDQHLLKVSAACEHLIAYLRDIEA